jgi:hypothetical protein
MAWDDQWYDVILHGQVIGSIFAQRGAKRWATFDTRQPLIRPAPRLDPESELWLLALATTDCGYTAAKRSHASTRM